MLKDKPSYSLIELPAEDLIDEAALSFGSFEITALFDSKGTGRNRYFISENSSHIMADLAQVVTNVYSLTFFRRVSVKLDERFMDCVIYKLIPGV